MAQSETPSVLDRVQKVDDPELGDLMRLAMKNRKDTSEASEILRKVTQSYAQVKLLDLQIAEVSRKADSAQLADIRQELLLAKAELESKRTTELANLRELTGVTPRLPLPFAELPISTLNAYICVQVIGERFYILDTQKPFSRFWDLSRWKLVGLLSEKETLHYAWGRLKDENSLPIRFHIYYDLETKSAAERLRDKIIRRAKDIRGEMKVEVRLEVITWTGPGTSRFYLRQGTIRTLHAEDAVQRPDGGPEPMVTGLVDPKDLEQHILWRLMKPKNVPLTFRIEYDEASASLAKQVADTAKAVIKRLGVADVADVQGVLVEPLPETAFLGRWQAIEQGDIQTIDVQPNGICQVTKGERTGSVEAGASVQGTWLLITKEIVIDINDQSPHGPDYIYWGHLDEEGSLILSRGMIYPQGSLHKSTPWPTNLKRVQ
jgi:hypothetical protein